MSASKKRKQRMENNPALSEKERKAAVEAAAAKRTATIYWGIGIVIAILVAILLVWNSGFFQSRATAATVDGEDYSVAEMSYYYNNAKGYIVGAQNQYAGIYSQLGMSFQNFYDTSKSATSQTITETILAGMNSVGITGPELGKTFDDYFQAQALEGVQFEHMMLTEAKAAGFTMSDEDRASMDETIATYTEQAVTNNYTYGSYLKMIYGKYMTEKLFETRLEAVTLANAYAQSIQDGYDYSVADYETYYADHAAMMDSYDYRLAFVSGTPEEKLDEDDKVIEATDAEKEAALTAAKKNADALAAAVKAGTPFNEAAAQYVAESAQEAYAEDADYNHTTDKVGSAIAASSYGAWLTGGDLTAGDITVVEETGSTGYYVVQYLGSALDKDALSSSEVRHILIKADVTETEDEDDVEAPTDDQMAAALAEIEAIQAEFEAGDKTAESFGALANEYSDDPGSNENGGYYEVSTSTYFIADFQNWAMDPSRAPGDLTIVKNEQSGQQGYHLMYFQAAGLPLWENTARTALVSDAYSAWLDATLANYPVAAADGMSHLS